MNCFILVHYKSIIFPPTVCENEFVQVKCTLGFNLFALTVTATIVTALKMVGTGKTLNDFVMISY